MHIYPLSQRVVKQTVLCISAHKCKERKLIGSQVESNEESLGGKV